MNLQLDIHAEMGSEALSSLFPPPQSYIDPMTGASCAGAAWDSEAALISIPAERLNFDGYHYNGRDDELSDG